MLAVGKVNQFNMLELIICLLIAATVGHLSQSTGLCMVRGMKQWMAGNPGFMAAILCSGVLAWVAGVLAEPLGFGLPFRRFGMSWLFALGGVLFGMGSAFNQGCGVSTLSRLSRGELGMIATISGWLVGWYVLDRWGPQPVFQEMHPPGSPTFVILVAVSLFLSVWLIRSNPSRRKTWFGMMGIGLLGGFLFLYERGWTPSGLLHDLSAALRNEEKSEWPELERYLIIVALLGGMIVTAVWTKRIQLERLSAKIFLVHLLAGTLMGIGAALARGGNDSQLLLTFPVFSPAGVLSVGGMLVGLYIGLTIRKTLDHRLSR